jgi:hypothetical protein
MSREHMWDTPPAVLDDTGVWRFGGLTAAERLAELDADYAARVRSSNRTVTGAMTARRRVGTWRFAIDGVEQFAVEYVDGLPVAGPTGWNDDEWPAREHRRYLEEREMLELILREYRTSADIERIYELSMPTFGGAIYVVRGLKTALDVTLGTAKCAVDAACERAKRATR